MALLTASLRAQLEENGRRQQPLKGTKDEIDFQPVVRLYTPLMQAVWLLTEIDPKDSDRAFGLCDLGKGHRTLDYVSLTELDSRFGLMSVRHDDSFQADQTLSAYAAKAGVAPPATGRPRGSSKAS